ncbi:hypothetical protein ACFQY4_10610 [Catellatospora bangladeshensis]|uniref:hypothetical protein n=1 Tax=Catellatospora bangladeshensis TaxID=310355 RepID=UPI0036090A8D
MITGKVTSRKTWCFAASQTLSSSMSFWKFSSPTKSKFGDRPLQFVMDTWTAAAIGRRTNIAYNASGAIRNPMTNGYLPCRMIT